MSDNPTTLRAAREIHYATSRCWDNGECPFPDCCYASENGARELAGARALAAAGLLGQPTTPTDEQAAVIEAARAHHPVTTKCYAPACSDGECDHDPSTECPLIDIDVCAACDDVREDRDPDGWLMPVTKCPVAMAVLAYNAAVDRLAATEETP